MYIVPLFLPLLLFPMDKNVLIFVSYIVLGLFAAAGVTITIYFTQRLKELYRGN